MADKNTILGNIYQFIDHAEGEFVDGRRFRTTGGDGFEVYPESSAIASLDYSIEREDLVIEFNNGRFYLYHGVPFELFKRFMFSDSVGRFFNQHIRHDYTGTPAFA